jgi:hypothetical protein
MVSEHFGFSPLVAQSHSRRTAMPNQALERTDSAEEIMSELLLYFPPRPSLSLGR